MRETPEEIDALTELMAASHAGSTDHLKAIVADERRPELGQVLAELEGMKVLSLATVTKSGQPRISAVDGHFLHGRWTFGTSGTAAKARHIEARPHVSAAHLDGERLGVFTHGTAVRLRPGEPGVPGWEETLAHWTDYYGSDPTTWEDEIRMYRLEPTWMVAYGVLGAD